MPILPTRILVKDAKNVCLILDDISRTCFNALGVVDLSSGQFSIDGGLNDIRAKLDDEDGKLVIGFHCRYEKDMDYFEQKIQRYLNDAFSEHKNMRDIYLVKKLT
ncbi:hypothetical protein A3Q34_04305 [Colwellia sp. PAMC 20917]|uniref:hypothetical protein n=1 Tax=Colwellia sp. PAMC 20917 TaxID=1816218 RepID=UPI000878981A|nr:hypothetical protein [Colwellia sp. PAMC 20917]AOW76144.1 hypothetical protein A3Q34_04305 [Colwellia sp. PAMC 20917]